MSGPAKLVNQLHAKYPKIIGIKSYKPFVGFLVQNAENRQLFKDMTKDEFGAVFERHLRKNPDINEKGIRHFMHEACLNIGDA